MAALMYVDVPGYAALIMRRTFPELDQPDGPVWQSTRWFADVPQAIRPKYTSSDHLWTFRSGAVIRFGHLDSADAIMKYQGGAYHFVGFDELTHFDEKQYEFIAFSRQRKPPDGPLGQVPMRVRASANPGGPGHVWVKRRFLQQPDRRKAVFIPAKLQDNPGIDTEDYLSRLEGLSPALRKQLVDGDWDAIEGAAYTDFSEAVHVIEPFPVPATWERLECMDHGIANPTAWHLVATDYDGNVIVVDTYYQPGIISDHAQAILERRPGWWPAPNGTQPDPYTLADPAVGARTGGMTKWGQPATIVTEYDEQSGGKITLTGANNDPVAGRARISELLRPDPDRPFPAWHPRYGEKGSPRMFVMSRCGELIEQLKSAPVLAIDSGRRGAGEIVDPKWEGQHGHAHAALRYGVMGRPGASEEPEPETDDPRRGFFDRVLKREREQTAKPDNRRLWGI